MATLEITSDIDSTLDATCHATDFAEECKGFLLESHNFKVLLYNIRSHTCNFANFLVLLKRLNIVYDVIVLTECWLGKDPHVNSIDGYSHYHSSEYINQNGGVIVYIKNDLQAKITEPSILEADCLNIELSNNFTIIALYRSPSFKNTDKFIESLDNHLSSFQQKSNILLMGDININIMPGGDDKNKNEYLCTTAAHGLAPIITIPTRNDRCIDHILIKSKSKAVALVCKTSMCDHDLPMAFISTNKKIVNSSKRQHLKTDYEAVAEDLKQTDWTDIISSRDVNEATNKFSVLVKNSIDKHTKLVTVSRSKINFKPWITPGLIRCMVHRDRLHLKSRKSPNNATDRLIYTRYRNFYKNVLRKVKAQYENNLLNDCKEHPKKLWNAIKTICEITPKHNPATEIISTQDKHDSINKCNDHFATIGSVLASKIVSLTGKTEIELAALVKSTSTPTSSFFFQPTDPQEISEYIKQLKNESAPGLDGIKSPLIKIICKHIIEPFTHICNLSLSNGCFPEIWKTATVTPIYKAGDKSCPSNYRPISLLSLLSKLLEKIANNRLTSYLEQNNLLSDIQFGFRRGRSTEHAVSQLLDIVTSHLDNGRCCLGAFLDLAKAFDTVSIPILTQKLENLGIRGQTLSWFKSYLTNRKQLTKITDTTSDPSAINYGVPQGSILGPTLFIIYMNDISNVLTSNKAKIVCYADDTAMLFSGDDWDETYRQAEIGLTQTATWLSHNLLTLNISKTNYICFHKTKASAPDPALKLKMHMCQHQLQPCSCETIQRLSSLKYLGVILDEKVNFNKHIEYISGRARKLIHIMRLLRNGAELDTLRNVYMALCQSVLGYCITCWGGASKTSMLILERAQRSILKVMLKKPKRYPTTQIYADCQVLTMRQLFIYRTCLQVHRNTINSTDYPILLSKRTFKLPVHATNTRFAQRFPNFLRPHTYNKAIKHCSLNNATMKEAKDTMKKWLTGLNYDQTEDIICITE